MNARILILVLFVGFLLAGCFDFYARDPYTEFLINQYDNSNAEWLEIEKEIDVVSSEFYAAEKSLVEYIKTLTEQEQDIYFEIKNYSKEYTPKSVIMSDRLFKKLPAEKRKELVKRNLAYLEAAIKCEELRNRALSNIDEQVAIRRKMEDYLLELQSKPNIFVQQQQNYDYLNDDFRHRQQLMNSLSNIQSTLEDIERHQRPGLGIN